MCVLWTAYGCLFKCVVSCSGEAWLTSLIRNFCQGRDFVSKGNDVVINNIVCPIYISGLPLRFSPWPWLSTSPVQSGRPPQGKSG